MLEFKDLSRLGVPRKVIRSNPVDLKEIQHNKNFAEIFKMAIEHGFTVSKDTIRCSFDSVGSFARVSAKRKKKSHLHKEKESLIDIDYRMRNMAKQRKKVFGAVIQNSIYSK